jgi:hypothetical protein
MSHKSYGTERQKIPYTRNLGNGLLQAKVQSQTCEDCSATELRLFRVAEVSAGTSSSNIEICSPTPILHLSSRNKVYLDQPECVVALDCQHYFCVCLLHLQSERVAALDCQHDSASVFCIFLFRRSFFSADFSLFFLFFRVLSFLGRVHTRQTFMDDTALSHLGLAGF